MSSVIHDRLSSTSVQGCESIFYNQDVWLQGLKPRQLAVLFRNNHFNTLFKFEDALYLLVTDQGYLHEQVVPIFASTCQCFHRG